MFRRKLLALAISTAALAACAAPAGAATTPPPEPHGDHIIAILIGQLQMPGSSTWSY
jgi:hypothetical protein